MAKAGAIIAIIAGIFGIFAALFTLAVGGFGGALETEGADTVVYLGGGGLFFSLAAIVLGAVIFSRPKGAGILLVITSLLGMVLGGTLVAVFMLLALVGGILAIAGAGGVVKETASDQQTPETDPATGEGKNQSSGKVVAVTFLALAGLTILAVLPGTDNGQGGNIGQQATRETAVSPAGADAGMAGDNDSQPEHEYVHIGDAFRGELFEITVNQFSVQERIVTDYDREHAGEGMGFAVIRATVKCIDNESRFYSPGNLLVILDDGTQITYDSQEILFGLPGVTKQLNPFTSVTGYIVYRIPAEFSGAVMLYDPGRGFSDVYVILHGSENHQDDEAVQESTPQ